MTDFGAVWRWLTGRGGDHVAVADPDDGELEQPWLRRWEHLPKRSAGPDFSRADYRLARERAREVARTTLGERLWADLQRDGHLDLPSRLCEGLTYRLRDGRRMQVVCVRGVRLPWA